MIIGDYIEDKSEMVDITIKEFIQVLSTKMLAGINGRASELAAQIYYQDTTPDKKSIVCCTY